MVGSRNAETPENQKQLFQGLRVLRVFVPGHLSFSKATGSLAAPPRAV
jgi:hypothetical protein